MKGRDNMKPITTQAELDAALSDRLRRERAKICKRHAEELQAIIEELIQLQYKWKENTPHQRES